MFIAIINQFCEFSFVFTTAVVDVVVVAGAPSVFVFVLSAALLIVFAHYLHVAVLQSHARAGRLVAGAEC